VLLCVRDTYLIMRKLIALQQNYFKIEINSTGPVFFYCAAPGSCVDHQMLAAINPNDTQTLQKQIKSAEASKVRVVPGGLMPKEGDATATSSPSPAPPTEMHVHNHGLSTAAIIGIAIGIAAFLIMCAALFFIGHSRSLKEIVRHHDRGGMMKPVGVRGVTAETGDRHSTFSHPPHPPQGQYPPDFGSQLPAYASPHRSSSLANGVQNYKWVISSRSKMSCADRSPVTRRIRNL
jgi:hypothetical protein